MTQIDATLAERRTAIFLRQLGFYDPSDHVNDSVTFIGCGGVGSFAAFGAAKLGIPKIRLIDFDTVEEHNVPNQMFMRGSIGEFKTEATALLLQEHMGNVIDVRAATCQLPDDDITLSGVVVSGLDSMEARKDIWEQHIKLKPRVPLYLDARLGGTIINLYAVNPGNLDDVEAYEKTLYSDNDAEESLCTERGLIDVGLQVGSMITRALRLHFTNERVEPITVMNQNTLYSTMGEWVND